MSSPYQPKCSHVSRPKRIRSANSSPYDASGRAQIPPPLKCHKRLRSANAHPYDASGRAQIPPPLKRIPFK